MNPTSENEREFGEKKENQNESDVKFRYTITPNQVYITRDEYNPSVATLTIGVSNDTTEDISCKGIQFTVAIGGEATDLTADPDIQSYSNQEDWSITKVVNGTYRALPIPPNTGIKAKSSITFQLSGIVVNRKLGTTAMQIKEHFQDANPQTTIYINKIRSKLNIDYFQGIPVEIGPGDSANLVWETTAAARVTLLPGKFENLKTSDIVNVTPSNTTTYYLTAFGEGPSITKPFPITVNNPEISIFTALPETIDVGDKVTLAWKALYSSYCTLLPPIDPEKKNAHLPVEDNVDVVPTPGTSYSLTAWSANNTPSIPRNLPIHFNPVKIVSFTVTPTAIVEGEPVTLAWEAKSAVTTWIDPGIGIVANKGQRDEFPNQNITYTLYAQGIDKTVSKQGPPVTVISKQWKQCQEAVKKIKGTPCPRDFCQKIQYNLNNYCYDNNFKQGTPILVEGPDKGLCGCCCGTNAMVATPGGPIRSEQLKTGDMILTAVSQSARNPLLFSWEAKPLAFSSGTGPSPQGNPMILVEYGDDESVIVTPDTLFLMADARFKTADRLVPGKDLLISPGGTKVPVRHVWIKKYPAPIHHLATTVEFESTFDGNRLGHLLVMNGVVVGDYLLQLYRQSQKMKVNFSEDHWELPTVGTKAYEKKYKLQGSPPAEKRYGPIKHEQ